jgi:hypothetical protein
MDSRNATLKDSDFGSNIGIQVNGCALHQTC